MSQRNAIQGKGSRNARERPKLLHNKAWVGDWRFETADTLARLHLAVISLLNRPMLQQLNTAQGW
jgi:hypothetical protein